MITRDGGSVKGHFFLAPGVPMPYTFKAFAPGEFFFILQPFMDGKVGCPFGRQK
jgi:hypothetical protein